MTREAFCAKKEEALASFRVEGKVLSCESYGNGHINDTFLVVCEVTEGQKRYILQRMNHEIFKKPEELMENVERVTSFIEKEIRKNGGDVERETLHIIPTIEGKGYYKDEIGSFWRMYNFIEGTNSFEKVEKPEDFYQSAYAFGNFQRLLADFDAATLAETIPDFHKTPVRYKTFLEAAVVDLPKKKSQ